MKKQNRDVELGIIGGTGLYHLQGAEQLERRRIETPWGEPSSEVVIANVQGRVVAFMTRHGEKHNIPPHKVNYRANIWALKQCGVKRVIAVAAVGGITDEMSPQTIAIPDQIIDYTCARKHTYFEDELEEVTHIDFTQPYSECLREALIQVAGKESIDIVAAGVYAATQGPRLETAAEIQRLKQDGASIVGMTGMPEAALARELELEYACCALVVNWAAGCAGTTCIEHDEMQKVVDKGMQGVRTLLQAVIKHTETAI